MYPRIDIKEHIEREIGLNDIGIRCRAHPLPSARHVYFKLCKKYNNNKSSLETIGNELQGRDHATVLHGIKKFSELYGSDAIITNTYNKVDRLIRKDLSENKDAGFEGLFFGIGETKKRIIREFYKNEKSLYLKKYNSVLRRLLKDNENIKNKFKAIDETLFEDISKLDEQELIDLRERINVFVKVRNKLKNHERNTKKIN